MTLFTSPISENAAELAQRSLMLTDRVLITGASGWFGRTATLIFEETKIPMYLTGSYSRKIEYLGNTFEVNKWNLQEIEKFQPTVVIDCAYLTREHAESKSLEEYTAINRELLDRIIEISKWSSVRKIISFSSGAAYPYVSGAANKGIVEDPYGFLKYEAEVRLTNEIEAINNKICIPRVWSVSGSLVTKINGFAFSDLISQARSGGMLLSQHCNVLSLLLVIDKHARQLLELLLIVLKLE
jgi:nucleoside-diphosphate-sugar epimerase